MENFRYLKFFRYNLTCTRRRHICDAGKSLYKTCMNICAKPITHWILRRWLQYLQKCQTEKGCAYLPCVFLKDISLTRGLDSTRLASTTEIRTTAMLIL